MAGPALRSLRDQLLVQLVFLASAAVLMVGLITLILTGADPGTILVPLGAFWLGSTVVFVLFGIHVVRRDVLVPLETLASEAETLATADRAAALPEPERYESREFLHLADRYRAMAEGLLDAQSQIVRVEKLAGVGQLAAGVAHEVRNPLGAIATYVEILRKRGVDPAVLDEMRRAVDRVERIVASLLDYARPGETAGVADAAAALATAADFLAAQGVFREHQLALDVAEGIPPVRGDRHAIEQVAVNLLLNACDAAPGGRIWAGVRAHELESRHAAAGRAGHAAGMTPRRYQPRPRRPELPAGTKGALLYVADDGPGVADADRERVFDPFYTTKDPGKGTGLGLAIVARTVHAAGGLVWVDRAREGGAAFKVFLPATGTVML
ncbi:MAG TPA: HAMP domain-containing sensor histidine kinase [Gemmatimonadales bacterium]|nr:HAMP domain-containing sensor histidine kinase [Gemmatimonadales bacterium]